MIKKICRNERLIGNEIIERLRDSHLTWLYNFFYSIRYAKGIIFVSKRIGLGRWWLVPALREENLHSNHVVYSKDIDYKYCMSDAERADVDGDYLKAIQLYIKAMSEGQIELEEYMNLAHLLWRCSMNTPLISPTTKLPVNLGFDAHDKIASIFRRCSEEYAGCSDVEFWAEFYRVSGNWKAHSEDEWLSIIEKYEHYLLYTNQMYFVCYLHSKEKYADKMEYFLAECDRYPTALNLYIKEIICGRSESPETKE